MIRSHRLPIDWHVKVSTLLTTVLSFVVGVTTTQIREPYFIAGGLIAFAVWLFLVRYFEIALALLMVGFPFYILLFDLLGLGRSSVTTFGFYFLTATSALVGAVRHNPAPIKNLLRMPTSWFLLALWGWMIVSWLLLTPGIMEARDKVVFGMLLMVIPFFASSLFTVKSLHRFINATIAAGVILLGMSLLTFATGSTPDQVRFSIDEDVSALTLAYGLGTATVFAFVKGIQDQRTGVKLLLGAGIATVLFVILLTQSRGPFLALLLALLAITAFTWEKQRLQLLIVSLTLVIVVAALLPLVPSFSRYERFLPVVATLQGSDHTRAETLNSASSGRVIIWQASIARWYESPVTGVGLGNTAGVGFAHNFLLETLVELGLVGLLILVGFIVTTIRLTPFRKNIYIDQTFFLAAIGLLVFAIVQASLSGRIQTLSILWVAIGMVNALQLENRLPQQSVLPKV